MNSIFILGISGCAVRSDWTLSQNDNNLSQFIQLYNKIYITLSYIGYSTLPDNHSIRRQITKYIFYEMLFVYCIQNQLLK